MRFSGDPNLDAFNWYKDQQKKRSGPSRVITYQNCGGYSVITSSGDELCSFKEITGDDGQYSCVLRINQKYYRFVQDITRILGYNDLDWRKAQFGYIVENLNAVSKRSFMELLYSTAIEIRDKIRPRA